MPFLGSVGQREILTQKRVITLLRDALGYARRRRLPRRLTDSMGNGGGGLPLGR